MALERRRPLPAGRYWLDITPEYADKWQTWRNGMQGIDSVKIEVTEHTDPQTSVIPGIPNAPARDFVIFSLTAPNLAWEAAGLPSPTIAPASITTADDTATKPPPTPSVTDQFADTAKGLTTGIKVAAGVAVVVSLAGLAVVVLRK